MLYSIEFKKKIMLRTFLIKYLKLKKSKFYTFMGRVSTRKIGIRIFSPIFRIFFNLHILNRNF